MKKLLRSTPKYGMTLLEAKGDSGVLCTLGGIFMETDIKNGNSRVYTESLIENKIVNSPYTVDMLNRKALLGEPSHPMDYVEVKTEKASHCVTELSLREGKLYGKLDILDTIAGNEVKKLIDYGCKIGVSARATGKTVKDKDGLFYPVEETYEFKTFDLVLNPGFSSAILEQINESTEERPLDIIKASIEDRLNEGISKEEVRTLFDIYSSIGCDEVTDLLKEELGSDNSAPSKISDNSDTQTDNSVISEGNNLPVNLDDIILEKQEEYELELSKLNEEIERFESKNFSLFEELTGTKAKLSESEEKTYALLQENRRLKATIESYKKSSSNTSMEILESKNIEIDRLKRKVGSLTKQIRSFNSLNESKAGNNLSPRANNSGDSSKVSKTRKIKNRLNESKLSGKVYTMNESQGSEDLTLFKKTFKKI